MIKTSSLHALVAATSAKPKMGFLESFLGWRSSQIISSERIVSLVAGNSERERNSDHLSNTNPTWSIQYPVPIVIGVM